MAASSDPSEAAAALNRAASFARNAGHDYLGTEHLLVALILDPGSRARRILQAIDIDFGHAKRELGQCVRPKRATRRRRRAATNMTCSFCGKQRRHDVRLVAGPGECICEECVQLAAATMNA